MDITVDRLQPEDAELEARLRAQAFQTDPGPYCDPQRPTVSFDRVHVARSAGQVLATVAVLPFGQWFGGRSVPMGGVAGVAVAPQARGHGLARRLLTEAIEAMHDRGEVISTLYPTTSSLYRAVGYEFGGRWERTTIDIAVLADAATASTRDEGHVVEALAAGELERMRPLYDSLAADSHGWLDRSDLFWQRSNHATDPGTSNSFGFVIDDGSEPVAGLTIRHKRSDNRLKFSVDVDGPFARSDVAFSAAARLIAGLGTTADRATLSLPVESLAAYLPGAVLDHWDSWLWMLRIVDVRGALTARGYNPCVTASFAFELRDQLAPWNQGHWRVEVADGAASVERLDVGSGGWSGPSLDVQTLSCLFTGFIAPLDLARAGRLPGADQRVLDAVTAAFAGPAPRLVDFF